MKNPLTQKSLALGGRPEVREGAFHITVVQVGTQEAQRKRTYHRVLLMLKRNMQPR